MRTKLIITKLITKITKVFYSAPTTQALGYTSSLKPTHALEYKYVDRILNDKYNGWLIRTNVAKKKN
jgi:hypothetical protein